MGKIKEFLSLFKKNKLITFLVCNIGLLIPAIAISTVAWFSNASYIEPGLTSSIVTSYFEGGTGTSTEPYIIYRPVQYYNLVQLHESNPDRFSTSGLYFQFGLPNGTNGEYVFQDYTNAGVEITGQTSKYLNMSYYDGSNDRRTIVPLGSEELPFIGHIVGNDLTIQNLNVEGNGRADIGIFGYVGAGAEVNNLYFKTVRINISTPSLTNTHSNHTDNARIGHLAGHIVNAKSSFNNVYTSNCRIYNSSSSTIPYNSDFGDYGKNDAITSAQVGDNNSVSLNPSRIYETMEENYSDYSTGNLRTRNTEYDNNLGGTTFSSALSKSSNSYASVSSSSRNYSLSTVGMEADDTAMNYRWKDGDVYRRFPSSTQKTTIAPANMNEAGEWVYYNGSKWIYYTTSESPDGTVTKSFNCYAISFEHYPTIYQTSNKTTYWLKYNNGSLEYTTTRPDLTSDANIQTNKDYLWCLKESASSTGINSLSSEGGGTQNVKLYNPANGVYLTVNNSSANTPVDASFVSTYDSAVQFIISGPKTKINYYYESTACSLIFSGTVPNLDCVIRGGASNGQKPPIDFTIISTDANWEEEETHSIPPLDLVTDYTTLTAGTKVGIIGYKTSESTWYGISTTQNSNNRGQTAVTVSNNRITYYTNDFCLFTLGMTDGGYYTFYDENVTIGYLCSASSSSNYLRTSSNLVDNATWSLELGSENNTIFTAQGSYTRNVLRYNSTNSLFGCYSATNSQNNVFLYKLDSNGSSTAYTAGSISFEATTSEGGSIILSDSYDTYVQDINSLTGEYSLFTYAESDTTTIKFDFRTSRVTIKRVTPESWRMVTANGVLGTSDKVVIAATSSDVALANTLSSGSMPSGTAITKNSTDKTLTNVDTDTLAWTVTKNSDNTYSFKAGSNYLAHNATSSSNHNIQLVSSIQNASKWTLGTPNSSTGAITLKHNNGNSNGYLNFTSSKFQCTTSTTATITLYKYYPEEIIDRSTRYISDDIGEGYDPNQIDVVGSATYTSTAVTLPARTSSSYTTGTVATGNKFYTTAYCPNSVVLYVPNTGSLDLGFIDLTYTSTNSAKPQFTVNSTNITLDSVDKDEESGHNTININIYNIKQISLCGLDSDNNVVATNANMNEDNYDFTAIAKFVVVITSSANSLNITGLDYEFTSLMGNTGDNGTSGYMEASYDSSGNLITDDSRLKGTVINYYYSVEENASIDVTVAYNPTTKTFNITFTSSVEMNVNFFNYDAENYNLVVNTTTCTKGSQTVHINAS